MTKTLLFSAHYVAVCPLFLYVSHRRTSLLCGLVGRDVCLPHFVSLTGVPALCAVL